MAGHRVEIPITMRPLQPSDAPQWTELWKGYFTSANSVALEETTRLAWDRLLDPEEPMEAIGAFGDTGQLLGFAHIVFHRSTHAAVNTCYLEDLYVDDAARGHGVGRKLVDAVIEIAKARSDRLYWITNQDNAASQRLYDGVVEPSGFIHYSMKFGT